MKDGQVATVEAKPVIELPAESFSRREERAGLPAVQPTSLIQAIVAVASDPRTDMDRAERLFRMHQEMVAEQAKVAFNSAMSRAQKEIQPIANNALNDHTRSTYAKLAAINKEIVPIYTAHGLSISFDTETANEKDPIPQGLRRTIAIVSHEAGHDRRYHIDLPPDDSGSKGTVNKTGVQAAGSTNSYARRYLVLMIFNVSTEDDDDGNKGGGKVMDEGARADFEAAIEVLMDRPSADKLWPQIAAACEKAGDVRAYAELKAKLLEKSKGFKKAAA